MDASHRKMPIPANELENVFNTASLHADALLAKDIPCLQDSATIPISIVSNSLLLSEGLIALLSTQLNLRIVGTYSGEFLVSSRIQNPQGHIVLLDSTVGNTAAISWTRYWHRMIPPSYVIILELASDITLILAYIEAGASGYTLQGA